MILDVVLMILYILYIFMEKRDASIPDWEKTYLVALALGTSPPSTRLT